MRFTERKATPLPFDENFWSGVLRGGCAWAEWGGVRLVLSLKAFDHESPLASPRYCFYPKCSDIKLKLTAFNPLYSLKGTGRSFCGILVVFYCKKKSEGNNRSWLNTLPVVTHTSTPLNNLVKFSGELQKHALSDSAAGFDICIVIFYHDVGLQFFHEKNALLCI